MNDESGDAPIRIVNAEVLADDWATLTKYTVDYRRRDGRRENLVRQVYDRGHGAAILPCDPDRGTVLLVRQFRLPVYLAGDAGGWLIEACAGLLDELEPEAAILREAQEELGFDLKHIARVLDVFMSPGSVNERLALFTAQYTPADRISAGGGTIAEGEDIEVLELPLDDAVAMIDSGEIADAKTIILLQHAALRARR